MEVNGIGAFDFLQRVRHYCGFLQRSAGLPGQFTKDIQSAMAKPLPRDLFVPSKYLRLNSLSLFYYLMGGLMAMK
jgi:hypothetical protein